MTLSWMAVVKVVQCVFLHPKFSICFLSQTFPYTDVIYGRVYSGICHVSLILDPNRSRNIAKVVSSAGSPHAEHEGTNNPQCAATTGISVPLLPCVISCWHDCAICSPIAHSHPERGLATSLATIVTPAEPIRSMSVKMLLEEGRRGTNKCWHNYACT